MKQKRSKTSVKAIDDLDLPRPLDSSDLKLCVDKIFDLAERYLKVITVVRSNRTIKEKQKCLERLSVISKEFATLSEKAYELSGHKCAYCGWPAQGNYSINRDGMDVGPTVDLCDSCGSSETPTMEQIWARIAHSDVRPPSEADWRLTRRFKDAVQKIDLLIKELGQ
jgi:hypothetical protein